MPSEKIEHEISILAPPADVLTAITSRDGLAGWNTSGVAGDGTVGSEWVLDYAGRAQFAWRIDRVGHDKVVWTCTRGPGDSVGTTVEYALFVRPDGRTRVALVHDGWPHTRGNFVKCNTLWGGLLHHLKAFVESGKPVPAYG
jgi:uncharacterized protein YndB with AHSA1/START domain